MDLLSNIPFFYEVEIELRTGPSFWFCIDEDTSKYLSKMLARPDTGPFLLFMVANKTRCVAVRVNEIGSLRIYPAPEKDEEEYLDNFRAVSFPGEGSSEIVAYPLRGLELPDCLLYVKTKESLRPTISYSSMGPDELAGLDYELSGHSDLRKFIKLNGPLLSDDYVSTDSIVALECDADVLGIHIPS